MATIADIKSAFYDSQRQAANAFETMVSEVLEMKKMENQKSPEPKADTPEK